MYDVFSRSGGETGNLNHQLIINKLYDVLLSRYELWQCEHTVNQRVRLYRRVKTPTGWKHFPASMSANGRVRHGYAIENGEDKVYPGGAYELRFYQGSRCVFERVGDNATEALAALKRKQAQMSATKVAVEEGLELKDVPTERKTLKALRNEYVQAALDRGAAESAEVYGRSIDEWLQITRRVFPEDVIATDMNVYLREMRKLEYGDRTVSNRWGHVTSFLTFCGLNTKAIAPRRPKYEKKVPQRYEPEELRRLFASIKDEKLYNTFQILLCAGLREQEAMYLTWHHVNLDKRIIKVRSNPAYHFKIKDREERDVPIPSSLADRLRKYRGVHPHETLVTGTREDKPNGHLLRALKRAVNKAGLGCGVCGGCHRKRAPECHHWFLHRFRATAITTWHRAGLDPRSIMHLSGHADLETVLLYLAPLKVEEMSKTVDDIEWL